MTPFDWDEIKAAKNVAKHGISFHEAAIVFADRLAVTFDDPDHSVNEERSIIIGRATATRTLVVVFVERRNTIRIISARKASGKERKIYEEGVE